MPKFCSQCGNSLEENARFCSSCGTKIEPEKINSPENVIMMNLNGIDFDLVEICKEADNNDDKILKCLRSKTNSTFRECISFLRDQSKIDSSIIEKAKALAKERRESEINELKAKKEVFCPKCLSTSVSANKNGFGLGKAALGGIALGPVGLLAGMIGSKKIKLTCLNCGNQFEVN